MPITFFKPYAKNDHVKGVNESDGTLNTQTDELLAASSVTIECSSRNIMCSAALSSYYQLVAAYTRGIKHTYLISSSYYSVLDHIGAARPAFFTAWSYSSTHRFDRPAAGTLTLSLEL
jgi:hypothetical protein